MSCVGEWCGDVFLGLWGHPSWNFNGKQKIKIITYHVLQSDLVSTHKWPFQGLSDLQLGDKKVTLNHLVSRFFFWRKTWLWHCFRAPYWPPTLDPHLTHLMVSPIFSEPARDHLLWWQMILLMVQKSQTTTSHLGWCLNPGINYPTDLCRISEPSTVLPFFSRVLRNKRAVNLDRKYFPNTKTRVAFGCLLSFWFCVANMYNIQNFTC